MQQRSKWRNGKLAYGDPSCELHLLPLVCNDTQPICPLRRLHLTISVAIQLICVVRKVVLHAAPELVCAWRRDLCTAALP